MRSLSARDVSFNEHQPSNEGKKSNPQYEGISRQDARIQVLKYQEERFQISKTLPFAPHVQILYSYAIVDLHYLNADLHLKVSARETCTATIAIQTQRISLCRAINRSKTQSPLQAI